ncbi:MAG TPA: hypothetical protein VFH95_06705 [Candidatus Kapabacteria bacterium]|nr:hypothetical protein [Candidatus Kapabacteria bacterium]
MDYIEFDVQLEKEGVIHIPEEYRRELASNGTVHVTVTKPRRARREGEDAIDYYLENPIIIPGFRAPSRDEMHDGR